MEYETVEAGKRKPKQFPLEGKLRGISDEQIRQHRDTLYVGYVNKLNEIEGRLNEVKKQGNATYTEFRELKVEEPFATNGIYLHEGYFENLGGGGGTPKGKVATLMERDYGSFDKWKEDFVTCGMSARGWVVLALNLLDGRLHDYVCERHDVGGVWWAWPLLILDVYEHAYFIDYGVKRADYIKAFMENIDWNAVTKRLDDLSRIPDIVTRATATKH